MGVMMETQQYQSVPMIGDLAPEFRAMTTMGKVNFPGDYHGSWVVLFSHPADFTPVCTTEFIGFSRMAEEFEAIGTKLIGLSIDSLHSHLAWARNIETIDPDGKGCTKIKFPIIADISMSVARKYGMIQTVAKTQTVRAVFVIDPEGMIRAILYYPMCTGRNLSEIKRIVESLQLHDREHVSTPANWKPGDDVILGAPLTLEEAEERMTSGDASLKNLEWYLTMKKMKPSGEQ